MTKLYRPLGLVVSVLGGVLASFLFARLWKALAGDDEVPKATDHDRSWPGVLATAGLQGAFYGLVKAAIDRAGASGFEKVTGDWPGKKSTKAPD